MEEALEDELELADIDRRFVVLQLDTRIVRALGPAPVTSLAAKFGTGTQARVPVLLGVEDELRISIWEASEDGLFSTIGNKKTEITVVVDSAGNIFIPYVGKIAALGSNVTRLQAAITSGLVGKVIDPQVQVFLTNSPGHKLSVVGDVARSGRFDVPISGLRLIEAIALAGGITYPSFESEITVVRGSVRGRVRFDSVISSHHNNIWLQARDTIEVVHRPRQFSAFGAVTAQSLQNFKTESVSLAEALAQSGGLNNNLSDAGGIFLFRFESKARLRKVEATRLTSQYSQGIPTIYQLNFNEPEAFFLARSFMLHDDDIIFVSNAPATEFQKFISLILNPVLGLFMVK